MPDDVRVTRSKASQSTTANGEEANETELRDGVLTDQDPEVERYEDAQEDGITTIAGEESMNGGSTSTIINGSNRTTTQISEPNVATFRILRKLSKALTRANFNKDKLEKLVREGRLPKGLAVRRFPLNVPNPSLGLQLK